MEGDCFLLPHFWSALEEAAEVSLLLDDQKIAIAPALSVDLDVLTIVEHANFAVDLWHSVYAGLASDPPLSPPMEGAPIRIAEIVAG